MAKKGSCFKMVALAGQVQGERVAQVDVIGDIGWEVNAQDFNRELLALGDVDVINLNVHSGGGSVFEGWAVANMLKHHPAKVVGNCLGLAASMGSIILCAADEVHMPVNSHLMIHNVAGGAFGSSDEMRSMADLVDKLTDGIVDFYVAKTGQERDFIVDMMNKTTWLTAEEAVELGFADEISEAVDLAAAVGVNDIVARFDDVPSVLSDLIQNEADKPKGLDAPEKPSFLSWLRNKASQSSDSPKSPNSLDAPVGSAGDTIASLTARAESAESKVLTLTAEKSQGLIDISEFKAKIEVLKAEAKEVHQLCAELGFSPDKAAELPAPNGGGGVKLSVLDEYEGIEDKAARRDFYRANKNKIWKEQEKRKKKA